MPRARPHHLKTIAALLIINLLFFGATDPMKVTAPYLIIAFVFLTLTVYVVITGVLTVLRFYGVSLGSKNKRITLGLTGVVAGVLALQSMGQLTGRDLLVLLPLALLAHVYFSYNRSTVSE